MAVTEPQRLDLHAAARTALGPEEGDTLMASLPPANTDIATRQDLERVETSLKMDIERLAVATKQDLERVEASLQKDLAKDIAASEARLKTYIWKVVLSSSIVVAVAIVSLTVTLTLAGIALLG